jgi:PAS domain S-box-containing protein
VGNRPDSQDNGIIRLLLKALDDVQEGISLVDKDGYVRYVNKTTCSILGVQPEELLDKRADHLAKNPLLLTIIEKKEPVIDIEYFMEFKGRMLHLINSGYPVFDEKGRILGAIDIFRGIQRSRKLANNIAGFSAPFTFNQIIGTSIALANTIKLAKAYSQNDENLLLMGESGTGKDLFAQSIHNHSARRMQPFVALNCANFPNELIDTELFGYEEGAFTGASKGGKPGKFETANGGTLFLDEIGEIPFHLQAKLLRAIETKCISRIGGNKPILVDVKIIAATNRNLETLVDEGCFRRDLYFRLKVFFLELPPLRDRGQDMVLLAEHFVEKQGSQIGKGVKGFDPGAVKALLDYDWPGNVRELEHLIARAMVICEDERISAETLLHSGLKRGGPAGARARDPRARPARREQVLDLLDQTHGNKKKAAELMGISRPTLYKILGRGDGKRRS